MRTRAYEKRESGKQPLDISNPNLMAGMVYIISQDKMTLVALKI